MFVDTSALYAVVDETDPNHAAAAETLRFLVEAEPLVTHNYVVLETLALVQRRLGAEAARAIVDQLLPLLEVAWVDRELHAVAVTASIATGSRRASVVDWASFEFMRQRGIAEAFVFDSDFVAQGFSVVPPGDADGAKSANKP
jgi:predicted nucleic acid-binding protein